MSYDEEAAVPMERIVVRGANVSAPSEDWLVAEEPLEIRVNGVAIAVVMRTPGQDEALVRGFLLTERIATSAAQISAIRECTSVPDPAAEGNVYLARLADDASLDLGRLRRNLFSSSSCGICGKASIEAAMGVAEPLADGPVVALDKLRGLVPRMRETQRVFDQTGGLHAAAGFDSAGNLLAAFEDIGRHNAVDKVVGQLAGEGRCPSVLTVSGRVSFEITQKALAARIPIIVAVSAPSALAVRLAQASGLTLCAFARGDRLSVYSHPARVIAGASPLLERSP